jgi:hypothetical protein
MKVLIGKAPLTDSLTTELIDMKSITNELYQLEDLDFTVPSDGSYYIGWQCYSDSNMIFMYLDNISIVEAGSSGIDDANLSPFDGCRIFPNPTDGKFSIEFNSTQEVINIKLLSVLGQDIQSEKFENTDIIQLEIKHPNGVYILELSDEKGNKSVIRIVKE